MGDMKPLSVRVTLSDPEGTVSKGVYLDVENIYCDKPGRSCSNDPETIHDHLHFTLEEERQQIFTRERQTEESGNRYYYTHISFRTNDFDRNNWADCSVQVDPTMNYIHVTYQLESNRCLVSKQPKGIAEILID